MSPINTEELTSQVIERLAKSQLKDGSFESLTSSNKKFTDTQKRESVFPTILILSALNSLPDTIELREIKRRASKFILSQKSDFWSFNYWKRGSKDSQREPYPDDLDDTFCALSTIFKYAPKLLTGKVTAKAINLLTALEKAEGGPYFTWILQSELKAWKDIDLAVNSNIAYFLSLEGVHLKNIDRLVEKAIDDSNYYSPYYASSYAIIYFISRFYSGNKKSKMINFLFSKKNKKGFWNNPLDTALAVSALINLGFSDLKEIEKSADYLKRCLQNNFCGVYSLIIESKKDGKTKYAGSGALTESFCLEAINKLHTLESRVASKPKIKNSMDDLYQGVIKMTDNHFLELSSELKTQFDKIRKKILSKPGGKEIMLVSAYFREALGATRKIDDALVIKLGAINLYGWIAYTIYDDFLDGEGDPRLLSLANICLKEVALGLSDLNINHSFETAKIILDKIDEANVWEILNCRAEVAGSKFIVPKNLPKYDNFEKIADRSLGHAIGPITILSVLGFDETSPEIKAIRDFFSHYIIARQLNDDVRDFEDDLRSGHLSPVVSLVVEKWQKKHKVSEMDLNNELPELQKIFWDDVVPTISELTLSYFDKAKNLIKDMAIVSKKSLLYELLEPIKQSTMKVLGERKEMTDFLSEFH